MIPLLRLELAMLFAAAPLSLCATEKRNAPHDSFPYSSRSKWDLPSFSSRLIRDLSPLSSRLKRDLSPVSGRLKRYISPFSHRLNWALSLSGSHFKRDLSPYQRRLKRDFSFFPADVKRDLSPDSSHLKPDFYPDLSGHKSDRLSSDVTDLSKRKLSSGDNHLNKRDISPEANLLKKQNLSPDADRLNERDLSHDANLLKKQDLSPDVDRLNERDLSSDDNHLNKWDLSHDANLLKKQDLSPDADRLNERDLSPDADRLNERDVSPPDLHPLNKGDLSTDAFAPSDRRKAAGRVEPRGALSPSSSFSSSEAFSEWAQDTDPAELQQSRAGLPRSRRQGFFTLLPPGYSGLSTITDTHDSLEDLLEKVDEEKSELETFSRELNSQSKVLRKMDQQATDIKKQVEESEEAKKTNEEMNDLKESIENLVMLLIKRSQAGTEARAKRQEQRGTIQARSVVAAGDVKKLRQHVADVHKIARQLLQETHLLRHLHRQQTSGNNAHVKRSNGNVDGRDDTLDAPKPAFSVRFTEGQGSLETAENGALKFTQVITNAGDGYNSTTGQFTAPSAGNYEFFLSFHAVGDPVNLGIYRSGNGTVSIIDVSSALGSDMIIIHLMKGEYVYVKESNGSSVEAVKYASLLGHLI